MSFLLVEEISLDSLRIHPLLQAFHPLEVWARASEVPMSPRSATTVPPLNKLRSLFL